MVELCLEEMPHVQDVMDSIPINRKFLCREYLPVAIDKSSVSAHCDKDLEDRDFDVAGIQPWVSSAASSCSIRHTIATIVLLFCWYFCQ